MESARVAQGRVSNRVERVPFRKLQTSPWGYVLHSERPGVSTNWSLCHGAVCAQFDSITHQKSSTTM